MLKSHNLFRRVLCLCVLSLMLLVTTSGVFAQSAGYAGGQERNGSLDELIDQYTKQKKEEEQKIKKGREIFEELLQSKGGDIPKYDTEKYRQILFDYADPAGDLRRQDPEKWELIDAYAYDYYKRYMAPSKVSGRIILGEEKVEQSKQEPGSADIQIQSGTYNRTAAKNYAYAYVGNSSDNPFYINYNPYYHPFTADCTNFVSQCLKSGGVPMVDYWWLPYTNPTDWYYYRVGNDSFDSNNDDEWSWSWVKVDSLQFHITGTEIGQIVGSRSLLQLGDVVQVDLDGDGYPDDHSMIVTKIDDAGERYVTYHTTNTKDRPLSAFNGLGAWLLHITY